MPTATITADTHSVLVIGHGLAGRCTVAALNKIGGYKITVVDAREVYEPDAIGPVFLCRPEVHDKFSTPAAAYHVNNVNYIKGTVKTLEAHENGYCITLKGGQKQTAGAVIMCVGSSIPLVKPSLGSEQTERLAELSSARTAIAAAKSILVAGGGSVGVETAGSMALLKSPSAKLFVAVSEETVLTSAFSSGTRSRLSKHMLATGVTEIIGNAKVVGPLPLAYSQTPTTYTLSNGRTIEADVFVPAFSSFQAGFLSAAAEGSVNSRGQLVVDKYLQSVKLPGVFAVAVRPPRAEVTRSHPSPCVLVLCTFNCSADRALLLHSCPCDNYSVQTPTRSSTCRRSRAARRPSPSTSRRS